MSSQPQTANRGRRVIAKNTVFNLLGQVLPMAVGVLTIPFIVHGLGTAEYGILSIATMVLGYFNIFDLGLSRATVKFVAENLDPENIHKVPALIWTSLTLLVGLGIVFGAIAAIFVPMSVTHVFKMPPELAGQARFALFVLCISMPVMLGNNALRGVLEAAQRFDYVNYVRVPSSVLFYAAAALAIPFGAHVGAIVCLLVGIRLVSTFVYLIYCFRVIPEMTQFQVSRDSLKPLAVFGGWVMFTNISGPAFAYLERFMIASLLSVSMLAFYSTPYELVSKLLIFPTSIVPSLFPYFSYHGTKRASEVADVTARTLKFLFLVLTPPAAVFMFFAPEIMLLWLGPEFAQHSTVVLQITTAVFFFNAFAYVPFTSVQALGRPDLKAILDFIVLPTYAIIAWWLIKLYNINGAAVAKLIVTSADTFILYGFASRLKAFSFRDCLSGTVLRAILCSAGLFGSVFFVHSLHLRLPLAVPLVVLCFAAFAYSFWVFAVESSDRVLVLSFRQRLSSMLNRQRSASAVPVVVNEAAE